MPAITHEAAIAADREFLVRRAMSKGYQYSSLLLPPLYTGIVLLRRRPFSMNSLLRSTWLGGIAGVSAGGMIEYARSSNQSEVELRDRRINAIYNVSSLRADDHSTVGALLGATLTPAIFWKRARKVNLFLGGAGIGAGIGLLYHFFRLVTEDPPRNPIPSEQSSEPQS